MKLIQTKDYLLLIDEEAEITKEWKGYVYKENLVVKVFKHFYTTNTWYADAKIVVAYYPLTKEAKELDLSLLPNPFEKVDVNVQTRNFNKQVKNPFLVEEKEYQVWEEAYIEGFDDGIAQSNKQFTLKDMISFAEYVGNYYTDIHKPVIPTEELLNSFIQSLSTQKLPKEFVGWLSKKKCTYDFTSRCTIDRCDCEFVFETITNSEGKEEIQGRYVY